MVIEQVDCSTGKLADGDLASALMSLKVTVTTLTQNSRDLLTENSPPWDRWLEHPPSRWSDLRGCW